MSELRQVGLWSNVALSLLIHSSCHTLALPSLWVKKGMFSRCSRCAQVCFLRASVFLFIPLLAGRDCKSGLACQVDMLLRVGSQGKFFISPPRGCKSLWHTYTHHLISDRHLPHLRLAVAGLYLTCPRGVRWPILGTPGLLHVFFATLRLNIPIQWLGFLFLNRGP